MGLGIIAMLVGLATAAAGAYVGVKASRMLVSMPGGLPALEPETVAMALFTLGALTMLLGVVTMYRSADE